MFSLGEARAAEARERRRGERRAGKVAREPGAFPRLEIARRRQAIDGYELEDFTLHGYEPQPHIKAPVAV